MDNQAKYRVLRALLQECARISAPPFDERLKSILASQIGNLLRGGHPEDDIRGVGIELVSKYDRFHGHESILALQRIVEQNYWNLEVGRHESFKAAERGPIADPRVAKLLGANKRDPRTLPGNHRADGDPCSVCQGPPGVHVSFMNVPELEKEAMDRMRRERELRRPPRKVGA